MTIDIQQDIRVLFWGMSGEFSYLVLERFLNAGIHVCGVVTHAAIITQHMDPIIRLDPEPPRTELPVRRPYLERSIIHLAWEKQIPVFEVRRLSSPGVRSQLLALGADVAVVACFSQRIPEQILTLPPYGFLNLHPSLLPGLRGPFPLFWSFRLGYQQTGVTVHHMDTEFDTGDIALQQEIPLPDGITGPQADALLATHGASLLVDACRQLAVGTLPIIPQHGRGSTYSRPTMEDFHIPTSWPARRAFNFIRGTAEWGQPYRISGLGVDLLLRQALSFDAAANQEDALLRNGPDCWIQFTPGVLHAR